MHRVAKCSAARTAASAPSTCVNHKQAKRCSRSATSKRGQSNHARWGMLAGPLGKTRPLHFVSDCWTKRKGNAAVLRECAIHVVLWILPHCWRRLRSSGISDGSRRNCRCSREMGAHQRHDIVSASSSIEVRILHASLDPLSPCRPPCNTELLNRRVAPRTAPLGRSNRSWLRTQCLSACSGSNPWGSQSKCTTQGMYEFVVEGRLYRTDRLVLRNDASCDMYDGLKAALDTGMPVRAWFDPDHPRRSIIVLPRPPQSAGLYFLCAIVMMLGTVILLLIVWAGLEDCVRRCRQNPIERAHLHELG